MRKLVSVFLVSVVIFCCTNEIKSPLPQEYIELRAEAFQLLKEGKNLQSARKFVESYKVIELTELEERVRSLYNSGYAYLRASLQDSAKHYYDKGHKIVNENSSPILKSLDYYYKASLMFANQEIDSAMVCALKSLDYAIKAKDQEQVCIVNNAVGSMFLSQQNLKKSMEYYKKAEMIANKLKDSLRLAISLRGQGETFIYLKEYDHAEQKLKQSYELFRILNESNGVYTTMGLLSKVYFYNNNLGESMKISLEALKYADEKIEITGNGKKILDNSKEFIKSDTLSNKKLKKLLEENISYSNPLVKVEQLKTFVSIARNQEYEKEFLELNEIYDKKELEQLDHQNYQFLDSIYTAFLENKVSEIEIKYNTEKTEKENLQLQKDNAVKELNIEKERKQKWVFAIGLLGLIITLIIFAYFYRRNQQQKKMITQLQRELHHNIKNNLAIVDAFLDETKEQIKDDQVQLRLSELQNRIKSIGEVHKQLYISKNTLDLNTELYLKKLSKNVGSLFPEKQVDVEIRIQNNFQLPIEKIFPVGLIVNEFLTNSYKYAFQDNQKGFIGIQMEFTNDFVKLNLSDNGVGLPQDFNHQKLDSFGIEIMKILTEQLGGSFKLSSDNGVQLEIKFEKDKE